MSSSEDTQEEDRIYGHAPLVRRRHNQQIDGDETEGAIKINTDELLNRAVDAGVTTLTALAVDRIIG